MPEENPNPEGGDLDLQPASQEVLSEFLEECTRLTGIAGEVSDRYPGDKSIALISIDEGEHLVNEEEQVHVDVNTFDHTLAVPPIERHERVLARVSVLRFLDSDQKTSQAEIFVFREAEDALNPNVAAIAAKKEQVVHSYDDTDAVTEEVMSDDPDLEEAKRLSMENRAKADEVRRFASGLGLDIVTIGDINHLRKLISTSYLDGPDLAQ